MIAYTQPFSHRFSKEEKPFLHASGAASGRWAPQVLGTGSHSVNSDYPEMLH